MLWLVFTQPGACWLVFTEAGRAGWFLRSECALAGFYGGKLRWLVFQEPEDTLGVPGKYIENIKEPNRKYKGIQWKMKVKEGRRPSAAAPPLF